MTLKSSDGSFLSRPSATQAVAYVPNRLNQYASVGGTPLTWDANGNLTGDGVFVFEYDEENRLRSAVGAGVNAAYDYDPLGRRRAKTVNGTLTRFVSDNAEEIEERDASQVVVRRYIYGSGIDERIALVEAQTPSLCPGGAGRCYYLTNWQGSTTTLVNPNGTLNATYHYGPYGEQAGWSPGDSSAGNPFRYTGRRLDPETGLYYYRARYYSPKLGRFLQTDPAGIKDELNLYTYGANNAPNAIDAWGEAVEVIRSGNRITLNFHIRFYGPGASAENVARYKRGIENAWRGDFGRFTVTANVLTPTRGTPARFLNYVNVPLHGKRAVVHSELGSLSPGNTGTWPANVTTEWVAAHEAGHLAGLTRSWRAGQPYPRVITTENEPDIMDFLGEPVTERTIESVLEANETSEASGIVPERVDADPSSGEVFDGRIIGRSCASVILECR